MSDEQEVVDQVQAEEIQQEQENQEVIASKADIAEVKKSLSSILDAVTELTKAVGELQKENVKWFRAGKMGGV